MKTGARHRYPRRSIYQLAVGDHGEALHVYRRWRELLSVVLGLQPTAKTQAVYRRVNVNIS